MDFFGGSGTTLSRCIRKNRSCVIIEKNKIAQKTIHNRLKKVGLLAEFVFRGCISFREFFENDRTVIGQVLIDGTEY